MKITNIVKRVNEFLAGEQLVYSRMEIFLDEVIDDINTALNATFPAFSELQENIEFTGEAEYDFFPDKYIRTVVCKGAASKFYTMDEEGTPTAEQYAMEYASALYIMTRDYIEKVPEEYRSDSTGSVLFDEKYRIEELPFAFSIWGTDYD